VGTGEGLSYWLGTLSADFYVFMFFYVRRKREKTRKGGRKGWELRHFMEHGHWGNPMPELTLTPILKLRKKTQNLGSELGEREVRERSSCYRPTWQTTADVNTVKKKTV
jgi:hypothetical protein